MVGGCNSGGGTGGGSPEKEAPPPKKEKAPPPLVPESGPPPRKELKEGVTEELSPAKRELIEPIQRMQYHDPDVIPMDGGGYGKIQRDRNGTIVGITPVAEGDPAVSNSRMDQLISQATIEDLNANTLGLLRRARPASRNTS